MNRTVLGLVLLGIVAGVAIVATQFNLGGLLQRASPRDPVSVSIFYGGEKSALLANPKVAAILKDRYRITLDATKAGWVEMVTSLDTGAKDCLWPSNGVAVEMAQASGKTVLSEETVFNSPIVLYAWSDVADAPVKAGVVHAAPDGTLLADVQACGTVAAVAGLFRLDGVHGGVVGRPVREFPETGHGGAADHRGLRKPDG